MTCSGGLFLTGVTAIGKVWSPMVDSQVQLTVNDDDAAELISTIVRHVIEFFDDV